MTDIVPVPNWGGVRQLETNEYATGGLNGNMNEQAKALAGQNMYSRLYAGLPFDPVFTAQVGGFPIGGKAALENGDIARSTVANNTVDPNADRTNWIITSGSRTVVSVFDYFTVAEKAAYLASPTTFASEIQLRKALSRANGKVIDFEGLEFKINGSIVLSDKSNCILRNGIVTALGSMPNTAGNQCIEFIRCRKFSTLNFKFDGNRQQRTPVEQAVHNIQMQDCHGFMFINVDSDNSICDGIYIGPTSTVTPNNVCSSGMFINCNFTNAARNNLSVIVGKQLKFDNCKFVGANGISPQAGVDIETNNYGVADIVRDISFDNCYFGENFGWQFSVIAYDNPKGIRVNGGTIVSNAGQNPVNGTVTGGVHLGGDDNVFTGVEFRDFTANSGYCVRITAEANSLGKFNRCTFRNIASEGFAQVHLVSDGIVLDDCDFKDSTSGLISLAGKENVVNNCRFKNTAVSILSSGTTPIIKLSDNTFRGNLTTGAAVISMNTDSAEIIGNKIFNANTTYYIQAEGVGAVVEGNSCFSDTSQPTKKAIRGNGNKTGRIRFNTFVNLHTTDSVELVGTQPFSTVVGYNKGGTLNLPTKSNTALAIANAFKGAFPTAVGLPNGTQLFCNDISSTATVYADLWYANGKALDKQDIINSQSVVLPAVNTGLQASVNITVAGALVGMRTNISFSINLAGSHIWAEVTAVDTVTIYRQNPTGANLPSLGGTAKLKLEYT